MPSPVRLSDGALWKFKYTSKEKLREVTNPNKETFIYYYDQAGRVVYESTFDGRTFEYAYNSAGRVAALTGPDGIQRFFQYNRLGRLIEDITQDGKASFGYDPLGRLLSATLALASGESHETRFERDAFGRLIAEIQDEAKIAFDLDPYGRRISRKMPWGELTRYQYDTEDQLSGLEHEGKAFFFERDALGQETRCQFGPVELASEYDPLGWLITQRATLQPQGKELQQLVSRPYQYDALGRLTQVPDARWGETHYVYGLHNRLAQVFRPVGQCELFDYDRAGALARRLEGQAKDANLELRRMVEHKWELGPGNRLLRTRFTQYAYDKRGRRVEKADLVQGIPEPSTRIRYEWDAWDRLKSSVGGAA